MRALPGFPQGTKRHPKLGSQSLSCSEIACNLPFFSSLLIVLPPTFSRVFRNRKITRGRPARMGTSPSRRPRAPALCRAPGYLSGPAALLARVFILIRFSHFRSPTGFPECVEMSTNKYVEFRRECEESRKNLCARIKCFQWKLRTPWTKRGAFLVWLLTLCSESRKGAGKYSAGRRKSSKPTRGLCFVALAGASWLSPASHLRQNNSTHFRK